MNITGQHPPRHLLETVGADPTRTGADLAEGRAHLSACSECAGRLAALEEGRRRYLEAFPVERFVRVVKARNPPRKQSLLTSLRAFWFSHRLRIGLAVTAAASIVFVLGPWRNPEEIRLKAGVALEAFVRRGGRVIPVRDGDVLRPGERLAFSYLTTRPSYVALWGIEDTGVVDRYGPETPSLLQPGRGQLPIGLELDHRGRQERLFALFSDEPLDDALVRRALRTAYERSRAQDRKLEAMEPDLPAPYASLWFRK